MAKATRSKQQDGVHQNQQLRLKEYHHRVWMISSELPSSKSIWREGKNGEVNPTTWYSYKEILLIKPQTFSCSDSNRHSRWTVNRIGPRAVGLCWLETWKSEVFPIQRIQSCVNVKVTQATQYFSPAIQHTSDYSCWLNKHKPLTLCSDKAVSHQDTTTPKGCESNPTIEDKIFGALRDWSWKEAGINNMSKQSGEQTSSKLGLGPQWCDQKLAKFCHVSVY